MKKKRLIGSVLTGILSVGIVGGMGASTFAMTTQENDNVKQPANDVTDTITQESIQKIKDEIKALKITFPEEVDRDVFLANLDPVIKEKLEAITEELKTNKLTSEEALEIRKQRITLPKQAKGSETFANMNAETRAKAKEILEKAMTGALTNDEAISHLEKLGIPIPNLEEIRDLLTHLTDLDLNNITEGSKVRPPRL
ncbi:hypothetical protein [Cytobacillus massiliigabonensis]|uniref:hypothetical protein n=1 Tax=Cytobacillus massiliigabonensis TaxID=1871011 RepID=UPI000C83E9B8|nr:hypothetical protein [Cytobacillus massiliigabonensis]